MLATEDANLRSTIVELCLTIPARLSSLLPHLPLLMRLMVHALRAYGDLVNLGLRTLEFWVDNLNPDFLYPVMCQQPHVLTDLMTALCNHLRPAPYPFGMLALRLLGKLGGRNRRFLKEPISLPQKNEEVLNEFGIKFQWRESSEIDPSNSAVKSNKNNSAFTDFELPLNQVVLTSGSVLTRVASMPSITTAKSPPLAVYDGSFNEPAPAPPSMPSSIEECRSIFLEDCDFTAHSVSLMKSVSLSQSQAALQVLKSALASIIDANVDSSLSEPDQLNTATSINL